MCSLLLHIHHYPHAPLGPNSSHSHVLHNVRDLFELRYVRLRNQHEIYALFEEEFFQQASVASDASDICLSDFDSDLMSRDLFDFLFMFVARYTLEKTIQIRLYKRFLRLPSIMLLLCFSPFLTELALFPNLFRCCFLNWWL